MTTTTNVRIPEGSTVYTASSNGLEPKTFDRANSTVFNGGVMTLPTQSVLYVELKYSTDRSDANLDYLAHLSTTYLPKYSQSSGRPLSRWDPVTASALVESMVTYFVPYDTPAENGSPTVDLTYDSIVTMVADSAGISRATQATPQIKDSSSSSLKSVSSSSMSSSIASSTITSPSSASSSAVSSGASSSDGSANGRSSSSTLAQEASSSIASTTSQAAAAAASKAAIASVQPTTLGAAIGGSVGGLIVGIAAALIAFACLRRRRSHGRQAPRSRAGDETTNTREVSMSKEMQLLEAPTVITGWQKHLPQEKDDRTITEAIKTIFDQVRIHMEGFYSSKPGKLTSLAASALEHVSPGGLPRKLSEAPNSLPILESILIRWIVRRISLRANAEESFLPFEYTNIPKQNEWHMENDEQGSNRVEGSRKGFPQAFSKWRMLTAFLYPDPKADQGFKKDLDTKIDQGVRALTEAFSPWNLDRRSVANRNESLRRILDLSYEAGVMLFAQPSTFAFDWSNEEGSVTVSPALVKRLNEFAEALPDAPILIAARRVKL